ncbi:MAG TPA: ferredoxin [Persephonella sp.]|uniref:NADH dehydrogenase i chain g n=1 Tax=Persephonella marina (strain DSM 14350 / EX-H1) TaxID=123214 RepID=C0QRW1_PERMH|nr:MULTISPECIES: 2Fe-2S iron-sulfur cluster-binding protein [Persephonella]ACO03580.1 NADH dehydrogenase i chain g [Persephonella marina EX-H1]HCB69152.1 ferredoxin [Persephonella sp.]
MKNVKVVIDGVQLEVPENTTVLEAAKKINKIIPTFCYHPKLPVYGGCRMCLVYDKKWKTTIIACGTKVYDGMEIETENEEVKKDRKFILEMLFTRHPLDCPVCDKAGECDLQNWGTYYGPQINNTPFTPFDKIRPEEDWESDYFEFISNRCVLCLRCVSVCKNVVGADALFQEERGFETVISPDKKPMDTESRCEFCGLCVDICPVGAIIFKPFKFKTRAWLLKETVSYCGMCSLNCPVSIDHDGRKIYRIRSTADLDICSGAYLGYDISDKNRLKGGLLKGSHIPLEEAVEKTAGIINSSPLETAIIVSPYSGNHSLEVVNKIAERAGVKVSSSVTLTLIPVLDGFGETAGKKYEIPDEKELIDAELVVIVGNDITGTNPVLSYYFHKLNFEGKEIGRDKQIIYIGEKAERINKYFPQIIQSENEKALKKLEDISFNKKTAVIYSTSSLKGKKAFEAGKILGRISKKDDVSVFIIPPERNAYGVYHKIKRLIYLPEIFKGIEDGKIKNLVVIGEDLLEHIDDEYMNTILSRLENIITVTPFEDGLALSSHIALGSSLWMEEEEEVCGIKGDVKTKSSITSIQEKDVLNMIYEKLSYTPVAVRDKEEDTVYYDCEYFINPEIEIWDFGYFSKRSDNLMNLKLKNALKERMIKE